MGDLDDAANLLDEAASYIQVSDVVTQAAVVEMVIARLMRVSATNPTIQGEVAALTKIEDDLTKVANALHYRKIRLGVIASHLRGGLGT